eukprot:349594-Lingulodinium_polyedra.AAC.1
MPWESALLLASRLLNVESEAAVEAAAALLLQFDAYLRPRSVVELETKAIVRPAANAQAKYRVWG